MSTTLLETRDRNDKPLYVTEFAGGASDGRCIQIGDDIQLTRKGVSALVWTLLVWLFAHDNAAYQ